MKIWFIIAIWLISGFVSWCIEDGYITITHPKIRKNSPDYTFMGFAFLFGPYALMSTALIFGVQKWTRRFWSQARKNGWDMVEKLES